MKVECVKLNLKDALLIAERFTGKQLSLPVLRYVLFIAGEKMLKIRATNLDIGIEAAKASLKTLDQTQHYAVANRRKMSFFGRAITLRYPDCPPPDTCSPQQADIKYSIFVSYDYDEVANQFVIGGKALEGWGA